MSDVDPRLQVFVDLFNIAYPDWTVNEGFRTTSDELKPEHVNFGLGLRNYNARCGPRPGGYVYYRLKAKSWRSWGWARRVQLVVHELAHVKHQDHSPDFWEQAVDNYWQLHDHADEVEEAIGTNVNWDKVAEHLVHNPNNSMVDNRVETAYERQLKLAEALDYPKDDIPPFSGMTISTIHKVNDHEEVYVAPDEVDYDEYAADDLCRYFRSPQRSGIEYDRYAWIISPPLAVEKPDGTYRVVEGDKRAGIIEKALIEGGSRDTMMLDLVDDDDYDYDTAVADD